MANDRVNTSSVVGVLLMTVYYFREAEETMVGIVVSTRNPGVTLDHEVTKIVGKWVYVSGYLTATDLAGALGLLHWCEKRSEPTKTTYLIRTWGNHLET